MKTVQHVEASSIIDRLCETLKYSRAHVAKILRENARSLRARKVEGRWMIPQDRAPRLRELVLNQSGPRYKLGETGPNAA